MLTNDPMAEEDRIDAAASTGGVSRPAALGLVALLVVVLVLRNDLWNWFTPRPLLFGFLPVGLWWQGLVSLLASILMWLMVRLAWPAHLETLAEHRASSAPEKES